MTLRQTMLADLDTAIAELGKVRVAIADTMYLPALAEDEVRSACLDARRLWRSLMVSGPENLDSDPLRNDLPESNVPNSGAPADVGLTAKAGDA